LNFTGVSGGLALVSADDPGGLSSQNEEDSRILVHTYANLPVFDPSSALEAKAMVKEAYILSESTRMCVALRPVMRVCHSRAIIPFENYDPADAPSPHWVDDRERYIMSAVEVRELGGIKRPQARHRWLNAKYREIQARFENSPFNSIEDGEGDVALVGCGIGYSYVKEAQAIIGSRLPVFKLCTLPIPIDRTLRFLKGKKRVVVFEELEPVVENLIKTLCQEHRIDVEILGRSGFYPSDGELTVSTVINAVKKAAPSLENTRSPEVRRLSIDIPVRTRTQCVGCAHRALLYSVKRIARKRKGIVFGDIGCHDAGAFKPLELQSTIYCMGSSVPMATGAFFAGEGRPVFSIIGDSTFFHLGINGFINGTYQGATQVVILCDNGTTAMTGFQPHPGSGVNFYGEISSHVDLVKLGESVGATVFTADPYNLDATYETLLEASGTHGLSLVVASKPCFLRASREGVKLFEPLDGVRVDQERCNGCMVCINDFGCPALVYDAAAGKVHIDEISCVKCGLCIHVCKRGAIV